MKLAHICIKNFRKLENCKIELDDEKTIFVGANNSGKTSAMEALGKFLVRNNKFIFNDIFVIRRKIVNSIGEAWAKNKENIPESIDEWSSIIPMMDIWLDVEDEEIQFIAHIIPTLKWRGGKIGVRISFEPKDILVLYSDYLNAYEEARKTEIDSKKNLNMKLWPKNLCEFLDKKINTYFELKAYKLDPSKIDEEQLTCNLIECINNNPLEGLLKIDMITAQRGFSDVGTTDRITNNSLSSQLRSYYDKHLDPEKSPTVEDLETLATMETAAEVFNESLKRKFASPISELENLGYPGISDPRITVTTKISAMDALSHESAVKYSLASIEDNLLDLPEKFNGLGYQNLISIVFQLMRFRDDWLRVGKSKSSSIIDDKTIEPIHLVLLEEPEAHLHVQVQQVLIRKSYEVLTYSEFLKQNSSFKTQLIVSTHSSNIAKECDFKNLRYFKRMLATQETPIGTSVVINLSNIFGAGDKTSRFVTRYLQTTHCDLFFADAAILIEGTAEEILLPHFIKNKFPELGQRYLSILMINGRHTHSFSALFDALAIPILVIADLDVGESDGHHKKAVPKRNKNLISTNYVIYKWLMKKKSLDDLLDSESTEKVITKNNNIEYFMRVAYQMEVNVILKDKEIKAIPTTFEDALIYTNLKLLSKTYQDEREDTIDNTYVNDIINIVNESKDFEEFQLKIADLLSEKSFKARFALDIMYELNPNDLVVPEYISEGLYWLQCQLRKEDN